MDIKDLILEYGPVEISGPEGAYIPYRVITYYHPYCDEPLGYGTSIFHQGGIGTTVEWEDLDPSVDYISLSGNNTIYDDIEFIDEVEELYA